MANLKIGVIDGNNLKVNVTPTPTIDISISKGTTGATGIGVPTDGLTGQVLTKASNSNYDTVWVTASNIAKYYGSFLDTTTQTATLANTNYAININTSDLVDGMTLSNSSRINVLNSGIYNLEFSLQFSNSTATLADTSVFIKINGINVPDTTGSFTVLAKHGSINGLIIQSWNSLLSLNAGDYVEMFWHSNVAGVQLITIPASVVDPIVPRSPSFSISLIQV